MLYLIIYSLADIHFIKLAIYTMSYFNLCNFLITGASCKIHVGYYFEHKYWKDDPRSLDKIQYNITFKKGLKIISLENSKFQLRYTISYYKLCNLWTRHLHKKIWSIINIKKITKDFFSNIQYHMKYKILKKQLVLKTKNNQLVKPDATRTSVTY